MSSRIRWSIGLVLLLLVSSLMPVSADTGDVSLFGQDLLIRAGETILGNASVVGGTAEIEEGATLSGDLAVIGGNARIGGTVQGAVVVIGGKLDLEGSASILGDVVAMGELNRHPDAQVLGDVVAGAQASGRVAELGKVLRGDMTVAPIAGYAERSPFMNTLAAVLGWIGRLLALLIIGVVVVSVVPGSLDHIGDVMSRSAMLCLGMGVLTLVAVSILMPLLTIIIVGIPVVLVLAVALALGCLVGWIAAATILGDRVVKATSGLSRAARAAVGIVLLTLVGRIPCLGGLATLLAICWGLGAVILTRFGTSDERIWAPFASLAGTANGPSVAPARPAETASSEPRKAPGALEVDEPAAKDDTRHLDASDLDEDMVEYTRS